MRLLSDNLDAGVKLSIVSHSASGGENASSEDDSSDVNHLMSHVSKHGMVSGVSITPTFVEEAGCIPRRAVVDGILKRVKIQTDSNSFRGPVKKKKASLLDLVNIPIAFALVGGGRLPNYAAGIVGEVLSLLSRAWSERLSVTVRRRKN